jgi:hypothetical protein
MQIFIEFYMSWIPRQILHKLILVLCSSGIQYHTYLFFLLHFLLLSGSCWEINPYSRDSKYLCGVDRANVLREISDF